jgi:phosphotriesterase-related protein
LSKLEEKFLRAAGRAALQTGAVVASHTVSGAVAKKQVDILESISPAIRFIWVHAQVEQNRRWHRELGARGVFIEFDSLGWAPAEDSRMISAVKEFGRTWRSCVALTRRRLVSAGQANGGTQKPYTYLLGTFVQKLKNSGDDDAAIEMLTQENPHRAFAFLTRQAEAPVTTTLRGL